MFLLLTFNYFIPFSSAFIGDFEQENVSWIAVSYFCLVAVALFKCNNTLRLSVNEGNQICAF